MGGNQPSVVALWPLLLWAPSSCKPAVLPRGPVCGWAEDGNSTSPSGNLGQCGRVVKNSSPPDFRSKPQFWPQASGFFPRTLGWGGGTPPTSHSLSHLLPFLHLPPLPHLPPLLVCLPLPNSSPTVSSSPSLSPPYVCLLLPQLCLCHQLSLLSPLSFHPSFSVPIPISL